VATTNDTRAPYRESHHEEDNERKQVVATANDRHEILGDIARLFRHRANTLTTAFRRRSQSPCRTARESSLLNSAAERARDIRPASNTRFERHRKESQNHTVPRPGYPRGRPCLRRDAAPPLCESLVGKPAALLTRVDEQTHDAAPIIALTTAIA